MISKSAGERSTQMFYSFAHNTNQIIGHKNFINLSKLRDGEDITFKVFIKEYLIHSSIMHTLALNFSKYYQQDYNEAIRRHTGTRTLFTVPFNSIHHLLQSNSLRVDDENSVLGFLFNYVENLTDVYPIKVAQYITEILVGTLRYNFLCLRKILSAIRRSEVLRKSQNFIKYLKTEMHFRVTT